jgi:hypothetical protein
MKYEMPLLVGVVVVVDVDDTTALRDKLNEMGEVASVCLQSSLFQIISDVPSIPYPDFFGVSLNF